MTKIAGSVDLVTLLRCLAQRRPVFHSEADFQHAFAWEAHSMDPQLRVRLETHPEPGVRLDLMLSRTDLDRHAAVELKYLTAGWVGDVAGEHFELKNQGAQDVRAYDVVKDIGRLERFVDRKRRWNGVFVAITNEQSFWRSATHGRATNADAFRIYDGITPLRLSSLGAEHRHRDHAWKRGGHRTQRHASTGLAGLHARR